MQVSLPLSLFSEKVVIWLWHLFGDDAQITFHRYVVGWDACSAKGVIFGSESLKCEVLMKGGDERLGTEKVRK